MNPEKQQTTKQKLHSTVTFRALFLGAILIPLNAYWVIQLEMVWGGTYPSTITLLMPAVFSLSALIAVNFLLALFWPQSAFNQGELLTVYVMLAVGLALNGCDVLQTLVHLLGTGFWYATAENEWAELFHSYLPKWLTVEDKSILIGFFRGDSNFYQPEIIKPWILPLAIWLGFISVLLFVMICINVIMRRQWIEKEKLAYPVIQLPLAMTEGGGVSGFFSNRILWMGFAIAALINLINGFSYLYPQIPSLPIKHQNIGRYFTERPWNAIGWMPVSFYPFAIGLGFFIPLDLCFSCWFFYLFWKIERVMGVVTGWQSIPGFPFPGQQISGVWIGLFLFAMWTGRHHLKNVLTKIFQRTEDVGESSEPMKYRTAILGVLAGLGIITLFSARAGMSVWVALVFFGIYFAMSATIAKIRAELGPPVQNLLGSGPDYILTTFLGTKRFKPGDLATMSLFYWFNAEAYRSHPMPHQLEAFKLASSTGMSNRKVVLAMMLAVVIGSLAAFWAVLQFGYKFGSEVRFGGPARWFARASFRRLGWWLSYPSEPNYTGIGFTGIGFVLTISALYLRTRLFWWPFHPVGYAISYWWAMNLIWFPLLISSVIKWTILKYAGLRGLRKAVPFFLGLILGDYLIGGIWSLLGMALERRMYAFWV